MTPTQNKDFYEIQKTQWQKSLFLFLILLVFYYFALGMVLFSIGLGLFFLVPDFWLSSPEGWKNLALITLGISFIIAFVHFYDARKNGARYILKRIQAQAPDLSDRYHRKFANTVEEMRIASGLPKVIPYIISSFAINSMALIENTSPCVLVSEGLLSEYTRDELQAVIAHELAHITRGDTFYITLVCSLANFFEKMRESMEPESPHIGGVPVNDTDGGGPPLLYFALTISALIMHLLSTLISRERELLADAAAVEISRNPRALARAIYKAHLKNSFVGDFNLTYSPLFIVPVESKGMKEGFFQKLFNSHPPLMKRIRILSRMVPTSPARIIQEVWEIHKNREKARRIVLSREEIPTNEPGSREKEVPLQENRIWSARSKGGKWAGPFSLEEILSLKHFSPLLRIRNDQEAVEAQAKEFPQIRSALLRMFKHKPIDPAKHNKCPRCRKTLKDSFYEGVPIKQCGRCGGKLVSSSYMARIISRKEIAFSEGLLEKANEFKDRFMENPVYMRKIGRESRSKITCPDCGAKMLPRPFSMHYVVPVDKCLSCHKTWFDADELEILQILIETH